MSSRVRNVVRNSFWGMICKLIQIICPFVVRTIMITFLGNEYTGLNGLFTSVLKILSLAELGFSSAITYNMYAPIACDDKDTICALLNIYKKIYRIVGLIVLGIGLSLLPFLQNLIYGSYPNDINIYILYMIYLANTCLTYFLFAYRTSLLNAYQRYDVISIISLFCSMMMYLLEIGCLIITRNYYLYALCVLVTTIMNNLLIYAGSRRLFPDISCKGDLNIQIVSDIKQRVGALLGHRIGTAVITSADNIVISSFLGLVAVTYYNNYYMILAALISVIDTVLGGMVATIGNFIEMKNRNEIERLFNRLNYILFWIVGWLSICFGCLIQDFIEIWLGKTYRYESGMTVLWFVLYFYSWKIRSVNLRFKEAAGMWKDDFWKPYVAAIVNIVVNIVLVNTIGIDGVLISTIIAMVFINMPWEVHVLYSNLLDRKEHEYYFFMMRRIAVTIVAGMLTYICCSYVKLDNVIHRWIGKALVCMVIPNIVLVILSIKDEEFAQLKKYVLRHISTRGNRF